MKIAKFIAFGGLVVMSGLGCKEAMDTKGSHVPGTPANSLAAEGDSPAAAPGTPDPQREQPKNLSDEEITESIRKKMMDTKMSINIQNVKISTQDGKVTLKGVVKSLDEKEKVEEIARAAVGAEKVDNWIEVDQ